MSLEWNPSHDPCESAPPVSPVVQSLSRSWLSCVQLFVTPWTAAWEASLSITNFQSSLKLMSIESVMLSNHLILCHPFLRLPSIFPSIRVFSNKLAHSIRWPKYWSFRFGISPSNEYTKLIFFRIHWFYLLAVQEPPTVRVYLDFPGGLVVKNLNANVGNLGSISGLERFPVLWGNQVCAPQPPTPLA